MRVKPSFPFVWFSKKTSVLCHALVLALVACLWK